MKQISIRIKFGVLVGILIAAVVVIISIFLLNHTKNELANRIKKQGVILAKNLSSAAAEGITTSEDLIIFQTIEDIMKEGEVVEVFVLNIEGEVLSHNKTDEVGKIYDVEIWHSGFNKNDNKNDPRLYEKDGDKIYDFLYPIYVKTFKKGKEKTVLFGFAHVEFAYAVIQKAINKATASVVIIAFIILVLAIGASFLLTNYIVKPIMQIAKGAEEIGQGNLKYKISIKTKDELEFLADQFNEMTSKLDEAQKVMLEQERLKYELDIATSIQSALIPKKIPDIEGLSISAYYKSAKEVGGDYYDFYKLNDGRLGFVVADVSGKGVPGAMVMVMTRSILKAEAYISKTAFAVLTNTNKFIYKDIKRGMFITAFYGIIDPEKKILQFVNAGHNQLIIYRAEQNKCEIFKEPGIPLGVQGPDVFNDLLKGKVIQLKKNDIVVQYTDGITEAKNIKEEEYKLQRLLNVVLNNSQVKPDILIKEVIADVNRFCGEVEQYDDIAILAIKI